MYLIINIKGLIFVMKLSKEDIEQMDEALTKKLIDGIERLGGVVSDVSHIKETVDKTLTQALHTNGRVSKLENQIIPALEKRIDELPKKSECMKNVERLDNLTSNTQFGRWMEKKPKRFFVAIMFMFFLFRLIPPFDINDLIELILKHI